MKMRLFVAAAVCLLVIQLCLAEPTIYKVGVGIADVTGPAAEINMVN